jgi:acyl-homoserine-lactone acylase
MKKQIVCLTSSLLLAAMIIAIAKTTFFIATAAKRPLAEQVVIRRDTYGVPHILAETEEAAAYAMGYAQAEDHAVEIARRFIAARGEEAKYTGAGIESDFAAKRYGLYEQAKQNFDKLSPLGRQIMNAYAEGFNRYVEKQRREPPAQRLPGWIPAFEGVDVLARSRQEVFRFAFNRGNIIQALQQKYKAEAETGRIDSLIKHAELAAYFTEPEAQDGSNLWSLAGSRTTSGRPILLGNPHQPWSALYWEAHVTVPGKLNFYGSTFVGRPMLTSGFNEHLGWTHTVNNIDLEDIYALPLDPQRPEHYVFEGKSMPLTKREFAVEVKSADASSKTERRTYWYAHLGPVVHRTRDKVFAIKSSILDEYRFYEGWYEMTKAKSYAQYYATLKKNVVPMFNIGYADADGNIFYLWNGMLPQRVDDGVDYRLDVPGATGKYVWTRLHRTEDLPQLLNPSGGYVQNCNDAPWWTSLRNLLDPKKYPSYIEPGVPLRFRSQMSLEMLESQQKFSLQDVMRLKFNPKMLLADRLKPDLIKAINQTPQPSEDLKRGLVVLEAWDNRTAADSRGGVLFQRFWDTYSSAVKQPFAVTWDAKNPAKTPYGLSDAAAAVKHFEEAVRWTRKAFGSENVAWGDAHRIRLGALDLPATGANGIYGLFHNVTFSEAPDGKRVVGTIEPGKPLVGGGDGWIFVVEFSKPLVAYSLLAYGETTNPASKHSTDQAPLFAKGQFKRVWFTEADIKANLEREYRP